MQEANLAYEVWVSNKKFEQKMERNKIKEEQRMEKRISQSNLLARRLTGVTHQQWLIRRKSKPKYPRTPINNHSSTQCDTMARASSTGIMRQCSQESIVNSFHNMSDKHCRRKSHRRSKRYGSAMDVSNNAPPINRLSVKSVKEEIQVKMKQKLKKQLFNRIHSSNVSNL